MDTLTTKDGKSLGNAVNLAQFFVVEHDLLERAYSPMTIRFFSSSKHITEYSRFFRTTLYKLLKRIIKATNTFETLEHLIASDRSTVDVL